jgi:hypothetical protein
MLSPAKNSHQYQFNVKSTNLSHFYNQSSYSKIILVFNPKTRFTFTLKTELSTLWLSIYLICNATKLIHKTFSHENFVLYFFRFVILIIFQAQTFFFIVAYVVALFSYTWWYDDGYFCDLFHYENETYRIALFFQFIQNFFFVLLVCWNLK